MEPPRESTNKAEGEPAGGRRRATLRQDSWAAGDAAAKGERPAEPPKALRGREKRRGTLSAQRDLFWAFAGEVPLRDDREAMSLPFVSLAKGKRTAPIEWVSSDGNRWVRVTANILHGMATIYDEDVLIWAVSQINAAVEARRAVSPVLRFHPHDMLTSIGRSVRSFAGIWVTA
jgi:plasmid replication initiation protein